VENLTADGPASVPVEADPEDSRDVVDDLPRRRSFPWTPVVLAAVAAIASVVGNRVLFPYFSGDADEPVYKFQGLMLLDGHLTLSAAEQLPFFTPWLSGTYGVRVMLDLNWSFLELLWII
jgi:hypothetical protein